MYTYLVTYSFSNIDKNRHMEVFAESKTAAWSVAYNKIVSDFGIFPFRLCVKEVK